MKLGTEKYTAFRTRFGLFEWLVCPFGLSGAPATFQRYVNHTLGDTLDDYTTAYLDDILIYSSGDKADHEKKVLTVLQKLEDAGLHLDLEKCEFSVKTVKYLGFIITAGVSLMPDPDKVRAIREWEAPETVKGVRSFLGFANFYREFLPNFASVSEPLTRLTRKYTPFTWGAEQDAAFEQLKLLFLSEPCLALWDPTKDALVETDCSGIGLGGCLSQPDDAGILRPVAYHSRKLTTAERNYTIHDKELLAVIDCLHAWEAELRGQELPFTILTDHKNLEYFTKPRPLSERQARWAEFLSMFRYRLHYRPGPLAMRPDALSRWEVYEDGLDKPPMEILRPINIAAMEDRLDHVDPLPPFIDEDLNALWQTAVEADPSYYHKIVAVRDGARKFPPEANSKEQVADCTVSAHHCLQYRGRLWVPRWEPLTTALIEQVHTDPTSAHPGKNSTFMLLARSYHWHGMSTDVARYVRNCSCYGAHKSRKLRQGLLQPIPAADQYWQQISVDFMTELPARTDEQPRYLMVITDRLSKFVQLEAMTSMAAEDCAARFLSCWWRFHGFPSQLISDRGSDWVGEFWRTICRLTGTEQLLSTAYHPQTDGGTERANQEVQAVLRVLVSYSQFDWSQQLPMAQWALNNRDSSVTGMSPNFLLHGYNKDLVRLRSAPAAPPKSPTGRAIAFVEQIRQGVELAQAAIAFTQQRQKDSADKARRPAEVFRKGDRVWLSLRNIATSRPSKKLDWVRSKYTVVDVPTPLTVTLDVPGNLHKTFHVDLVERAANDPLPSQIRDDWAPEPILVDDGIGPTPVPEYQVEKILRARNRRGRGKAREVLVKWFGYRAPTWEPLSALEDCGALHDFEAEWGDPRTNDGPRAARYRAARK
ncbi:hypothetical protein ARSEF4850_009223 [Beauveria asiatica]